MTAWRDEALEATALGSLTLDGPWALGEGLSTLVRESGRREEEPAVEGVTARPGEGGRHSEIKSLVCVIGLPRESSLEVYGPNARTVAAKTPAMAASTDGLPIRGELVYLPSGYAQGVGDLFASGLQAEAGQVAGKVILTEGLPMPQKVADLTSLGALAAVFISPGERIHEGICTTIWGSPDLDSLPRQPTLPVLGVSRDDGARLIEEAQAGGVEVGVVTRLDTAWRPIPVLVAEIPAGAPTAEADKFVLLHAHLDSWHVGVGDNATGDATLLELARVFARQRSRLARTLRIAWWSGHSHGRYAGSTWYADEFALDLVENCVAQVNCDSPGCRWADSYDDLTVMSELEAVTLAAARDATGIEPRPARPPRAGDYSFNNLGISGSLMLSSTMSEAARQERGYYAVGGCGGNIAWHTEDDTLEIADRENLLRDMRLYAALLLRLLNAPLHPLDFRRTVDDFAATLERYADAVGDHFDFGPARVELRRLRDDLARYYSAAYTLTTRPLDDPAVRQFNATLRALARLLVPVNHGRGATFRHDPALDVQPLPDLAPALLLSEAQDRSAAADGDRLRVIATHLLRGRNRLIWTLRQARALVAHVPTSVER